MNQNQQLLSKIVESAQQLDALLMRETAPQEVFQPQNVALRSQLEQLTMQLIFLSPREYGKEAEDLLYRKVYYDIKNLRKTQRALAGFCSPEGSYQEHLKKGIRVYHHIFFSIQALFELKLDNYIDWPSSYPVSQGWRAVSPSVEDMDWARKFCHCCLLRIGDLYHSLKEFMDSYAEKQAEKYFYKALTLIPEMGLPFMHLATLSGEKYFHFEATYFYQCCIYSKVPHAGASLGLEQIYLKVENAYRRLTGGLRGKVGPEQRQGEDVQRLLVSFLYLQSLLKPSCRKDLKLERLCEGVLQDFQLCLAYLSAKDGQGWARGLGGEQKHGSPLPNQLLFQMVILCLLTIDNLKRTNLELCKAAISFSLVFFSHIAQLVGGNIQARLPNQLAPGRAETQEAKAEKPWLEDGELGPELPTPHHPASVNLGKLSQNDQESYFSIPPPGPGDSWEDSKPMEVSDLDVTYGVLQDSEGWREISYCSLSDSDSSFSEQLSEEEKDERPSEEKEISSSWTHLKVQALQKRLDILSGEGLLPTLKVILQWLVTEPALTELNMHMCPGLWSDLLVVLNLLPRTEELRTPHLGLAPRLQELLPHFEQQTSPISMPLPEDVILHTLTPFQAAHSTLNFELDKFPTFSRDETALRSCILRTFGHFATQLPQSLVLFDSTLGFFLKTIPMGKTPSQDIQEEGAPACSKKGTAQQQLQKEVESLERSFQLLRIETALSPYLIIDTMALFQYLSLIREIAQSGRFIIIIPRIVIDELDRRKNDPLAHHALRFLEDEMKIGNRHFRCQVEIGKKFVRPKLGGGENDSAWNLYGILCNYEEVIQVAGEEAENVRGMVTILTALNLEDDKALLHPLRLAFETAHNAGVAISHVLPFYSHWKTFSQNT